MNKLYLIIASLFIILASCNKNKFEVDTDNIDITLNINRFDIDMFKFNADSADFYITKYQDTYGGFYNLLNYVVFQFGTPKSPKYVQELDGFVKYWKIQEIDKIIKSEFNDFSPIEKQLTEGYKHYKYYFPDNYIPNIYTFFSGFGYSVLPSDSLIGIGLDKYLGPNHFDLYEKTGTSKYLQKRMRKEMIAVDVMKAQAISDFPFVQDKGTLLENMIYEGKLQYYLNCMLPNINDTLKWRYTSKQMNWAQSNQKHIWNYLAENKLLFTTDKLEIKKFVGDAPFTNPFSNKSAPRAGTYIGYKIVEAYMDNNPNVSLNDLMLNTDSRKILTFSKYNP